MRASLSVRVTLLLVLGAAPALADAAPKFHNAWFLPVGVSGGLAIHSSADDGFVGGLEASIVRNDDYDWAGAYADIVRDFAAETTRFSLGPEIGSAFLGIDGGYVAELGRGRTRHGIALRPMFSLGFIMLYGRVEWIGSDPSETLGELGLLFKFPIELHNEPRYRPEPYAPPSPPPARGEPAPEAPPAPLAPSSSPPPGPFAEPPPG